MDSCGSTLEKRGVVLVVLQAGQKLPESESAASPEASGGMVGCGPEGTPFGSGVVGFSLALSLWEKKEGESDKDFGEDDAMDELCLVDAVGKKRFEWWPRTPCRGRTSVKHQSRRGLWEHCCLCRLWAVYVVSKGRRASGTEYTTTPRFFGRGEGCAQTPKYGT
jgi:hypothetical protein